MLIRRRVRARRDGVAGCRLNLTEEERAVLANVPVDLIDVLSALNSVDASASAGPEEAGGIPPALKRLFPPAYTRDDNAEAAYVAIVRAELLDHHKQSLETLVRTAAAEVLTAEQTHEWLGALNDLRLVLGTVLDVRESDPLEQDWSTPRGNQLGLYHFLSGLLEELVAFTTGWLPDPVPGADDTVPDDPWGDPIGGVRWDGTLQPEEPK